MFGFATPLAISLRRGILPTTRQTRKVIKTSNSYTMCTNATSNSTGVIGFIGLGVMGLPMATNIANNHDGEMVVWNRTNSRADELLGNVKSPNRIRIASTPGEVVRESEITYSMLSTPAASREVLHEGEDSALNSLNDSKGFVDCSTLTESDMLSTAIKAKSLGAKFLEAPVSGSLGPAMQGSLIFLCGGDRILYDTISNTTLQAMGKKSLFLGGTGTGTRMKLVVNQIMGAALAALAEGIALTEASELNVEDLLSVLEIGATGNPMFKLKGPNMASSKRDYTTNFPLEHALKDMKFAQELGANSGVDMPVAKSATELYQKAQDLGLGRDDFSAVMESVRAVSKVA